MMVASVLVQRTALNRQVTPLSRWRRGCFD